MSSVKFIWVQSIRRVVQQVCPDLEFSPQAVAMINDIVKGALRTVITEAGTIHTITHCSSFEDSTFQHIFGVPLCGAEDIGTADGVLNVKMAIRSPDDRPPIENRAPILTVAMVDQVVRLILPGDLEAHGKAAAEKMVHTFKSNYNFKEGGNMATVSRLQFPPERIALVLNILFQLAPTVHAAVYMGALLDYLVAELVGAARRITKVDAVKRVELDRLKAAIRLDVDLSKSIPIAQVMLDNLTYGELELSVLSPVNGSGTVVRSHSGDASAVEEVSGELYNINYRYIITVLCLVAYAWYKCFKLEGSFF